MGWEGASGEDGGVEDNECPGWLEGLRRSMMGTFSETGNMTDRSCLVIRIKKESWMPELTAKAFVHKRRGWKVLA